MILNYVFTSIMKYLCFDKHIAILLSFDLNNFLPYTEAFHYPFLSCLYGCYIFGFSSWQGYHWLEIRLLWNNISIKIEDVSTLRLLIVSVPGIGRITISLQGIFSMTILALEFKTIPSWSFQASNDLFKSNSMLSAIISHVSALHTDRLRHIWSGTYHGIHYTANDVCIRDCTHLLNLVIDFRLLIIAQLEMSRKRNWHCLWMYLKSC